jgi:IMP dehydrogenase
MDIPLGLSYDDVLLVPQYSDISSRREIDISSSLTSEIILQVPVLSANMSSTTELDMALAMARAGGIGMIHRFMTVENHASMVAKVKRERNYIISSPYTVQAHDLVRDAAKILIEKGISGLPVVSQEGELVGLCTRRDMLSAGRSDLPISDIMTPHPGLVVGFAGMDSHQAKEVMIKHRVEKLPLVDTQGKLAGLITMKDIVSQYQYPSATVDSLGRLRVGAALGVQESDYLRAEALAAANVDIFCLDIAHGHSKAAIDMIKHLKSHYHIPVIAGNVATAEGAADLIRAGADTIKVHVGPGSTCITRMVAGVGVPTLTAVLNTAKICRAAGVPLCADGGIRRGGDMAKAIGAGADTIMVGNKLAATKEAPGEVVKRSGRPGLYKRHYGMASDRAASARRDLDKVKVEKEYDLWSAEQAGHKPPPEGVESYVAYREETVAQVLHELTGGLRSGMSYSNARDINTFHEKARFIRITPAGLIESMPHDLEH